MCYLLFGAHSGYPLGSPLGLPGISLGSLPGGALGVSLSTWLPDVSQMPPSCLLDASQMPPRWLQDDSQMTHRASQLASSAQPAQASQVDGVRIFGIVVCIVVFVL